MEFNLKVIGLEEAVEKGFLSRFSPLYTLSKVVGVKWLVWSGEFFLGPAVEMAELVDILTRNGGSSFLDLFCGTGALSRIALLNGFSNVTCVDTFAEACRRNLSDFKGRVRVVECDVFNFDFNGYYEVVVVDPLEELIPRTIREVLPRLDGRADLVVLWVGPVARKSKAKRFARRVNRLFPGTSVLEFWGSIVCCSPLTDYGAELMSRIPFERGNAV